MKNSTVIRIYDENYEAIKPQLISVLGDDVIIAIDNATTRVFVEQSADKEFAGNGTFYKTLKELGALKVLKPYLTEGDHIARTKKRGRYNKNFDGFDGRKIEVLGTIIDEGVAQGKSPLNCILELKLPVTTGYRFWNKYQSEQAKRDLTSRLIKLEVDKYAEYVKYRTYYGKGLCLLLDRITTGLSGYCALDMIEYAKHRICPLEDPNGIFADKRHQMESEIAAVKHAAKNI